MGFYQSFGGGLLDNDGAFFEIIFDVCNGCPRVAVVHFELRLPILSFSSLL